MASYLPRQSVAGLNVFPRWFWSKTSFIPTFVRSLSPPVKYARWRNHVTVCFRKNLSSSSQDAQTLDVAVTTIIAVKNVSTTGWRCVLENLHVAFVKIGFRKCGRRLTKLSNRSRSARQRGPPRGRTIPWTTPLNCTHWGRTSGPTRQEKGWRVDLAEGRLDRKGSSSKRSHRKSSKTVSSSVSSSVSVVDRSSWSNGPSGTRGGDPHCRHSDDRSHKDHHQGSSRRHESPRAESARRHSPRRHERGKPTRYIVFIGKIQLQLQEWCWFNGPSRISKIYSDKLLYRTDKSNDTPVKVTPHRTLNYSRCVIWCKELAGMNEEDIQEELQSQEVTKVERMKRHKDWRLIPADLYILTINGQEIPK